MKFNVIVSDPPYHFSDKLNHGERGAEYEYEVMKDEDILNIPLEMIVAEDAVLALWVPSSKLEFGMELLKKYGFRHKQTFIWVKTKQNPLADLFKSIKNKFTNMVLPTNWKKSISFLVSEAIDSFDINQILNFGMGRIFRNTHEIALIGTRGSVYDKIQNKSQRTVYLSPLSKHSQKPEALQDMLDLIFADTDTFKPNKLELFARRDRSGWVCVGLQSPSTWGENVYDSIKRLSEESDLEAA